MIAKFQINKKWFIPFCSILGFIPILFFSPVSASDEILPEIMVGQTEVSQTVGQSSKIYYGGFTGNEIILNHTTDTLAGFEYSKTAHQGLATCIDGELIKIPACFILQVKPTSNAVKLLRGRTFINGKETIELSALLYGSRLISGDAYSGGTDLANFSFWGKSLAQSSKDLAKSDAPWKVGNYELNNDSQSSWLNNSGEETETIHEFSGKLADLYSNSTEINDEAVTLLHQDSMPVNLYLWADKDRITGDVFQLNKNSYPDGKVWSVSKDLVVGENKKIIYRGNGTIIVKGNLVVGKGTSFQPADPNVDHLGIIVLDE